ncbi:hypothetical protein C4J81_07485 [Deltaproteobacteria bacterium Smac51]|nr:hypothetical protein C4J81_07485 [Deltaproteobacteria bacterium Smac51]
MGYTGGNDRLGLWEFQTENGATERLQKRESNNDYAGPAAEASGTFRRVAPNNARPIDLDK